MKITKRGTPLKERIWKGKCSECNSEAETTTDELKSKTDPRDSTQFAWAKCPFCGVGNDIYGGMLFYPK